MISPTQQKLYPTRAGFSPDDLTSLLVAVPLQVVSPPASLKLFLYRLPQTSAHLRGLR